LVRNIRNNWFATIVGSQLHQNNWFAIAPSWKVAESREAMTDRQLAEDTWVEVDERMTLLPIRRGRCDGARPRFGTPLTVSHVEK